MLFGYVMLCINIGLNINESCILFFSNSHVYMVPELGSKSSK
jgi:hypothetical protein